MLSACLWSNSLFQKAWKESTYCVYSGPLLSLSSPSRCLLSFSRFPRSMHWACRRWREEKRGIVFPEGPYRDREADFQSDPSYCICGEWASSPEGGFSVYSFPSLFAHVFFLPHFFSCTQKYEICSSAAEGTHREVWQTKPWTMRLPDGIHRNEARVALQNGCMLFESLGWTHQPPGVSRFALKALSSVRIYHRKDTPVSVGIRWTPVFPIDPC